MAEPFSPPLPTDPGAYGPQGRSAWLDVDWRRHQRYEEIAGRQVNVVTLGESERAVVFIHGLSGSWANWLENLPFFAARGYRAVAFDLPGFGWSEMPAERISIPAYGRFVDALMGRLGIAAATVVGNSMGGFVGAEVAIEFPARVERLVLVSAAGLSVEYQRNERALAALRTLQDPIMVYGGWLGTRSETLARRPRARRALMAIVAHRADRLPGPLVAEQVRGSGKPGFVPALDALTGYPIRAGLAGIACPTLIVWGTNDRMISVRDADEFERLIPGARKVVWPKTGHVAMLERPAAFNALVAAFLEGGPPAGGGGGGPGARRISAG
jgi:pimeloyl-ACP methyl ester carboxylesterase